MAGVSSADRVRKHNDALKAQGGRIIHKLRLKPEAANALEELEKQGKSATQIINELLSAVDTPAQKT